MGPRLIGGLILVPAVARLQISGLNFQCLRGSSSRAWSRPAAPPWRCADEFAGGRAVLGQRLLEGVDLLVALSTRARAQVLDAHDQHVLVMRAVEDADRAAPRRRAFGCARDSHEQAHPGRLAETGDADAGRTDGPEHLSDGTVLAGGVGALQDDQQRPPALGIEPLLQIVDRFGVVLQPILAGILVRKAVGQSPVGSSPRREGDAGGDAVGGGGQTVYSAASIRRRSSTGLRNCPV